MLNHSTDKWIIVDQDLEVEIETLYQYQTYSGLLIGRPNAFSNKRVWENITERAKRKFHASAVYCIPPTERIINPELQDLSKPEKVHQELPEIVCELVVSSSKVKNENDDMFSKLMIVFLQQNFAFPIEQDIVEKISTIPYKQHCYFYSPF